MERKKEGGNREGKERGGAGLEGEKREGSRSRVK